LDIIRMVIKLWIFQNELEQTHSDHLRNYMHHAPNAQGDNIEKNLMQKLSRMSVS